MENRTDPQRLHVPWKEAIPGALERLFSSRRLVGSCNRPLSTQTSSAVLKFSQENPATVWQNPKECHTQYKNPAPQTR